MNLFFRNMTEEELENSKEGMILGFFVAMFLLLINIFYHLAFNENLMSSLTIFIIVFIITLGYEWFLKRKKKKI